MNDERILYFWYESNSSGRLILPNGEIDTSRHGRTVDLSNHLVVRYQHVETLTVGGAYDALGVTPDEHGCLDFARVGIDSAYGICQVAFGIGSTGCIDAIVLRSIHHACRFHFDVAQLRRA